MSESKQAILEVIRNKQSFVIMTHREPDGDAIGSSFALGRFLESIGKTVTYYAREPMPKTVGKFLPNYRGFEDQLPERTDALFVVDCATPQRLGMTWSEDEAILSRFMTINIDHHISNTYFGNISLIDSKSASTSLMIYDILMSYDPSLIDIEIANAILWGILTDTGAFENLSTDPISLRIAASLLERWADYHGIINACFQSNKASLIALLPQITQQCYLFHNQRVAGIIIEKHLLSDWSGQEEVVSRFILRHILMTLDADIVFLVLELPSGEKKLSFRSRHIQNDMNALASQFWGGGHTVAAGARTRLENREILRIIETYGIPKKGD